MRETPQKNVDFYTTGLGLRLVKKTVNFDDPGTYHLYYGDTSGKPGTLMTFFPWLEPSREAIEAMVAPLRVPESNNPESLVA